MTKATEFLSRAKEQAGDAVQVVEIGGGCNNHCYFCNVLDQPYETDFEYLAETIRTGAAQSRTDVVLTGHEPTIHPQFVDLVKFARDTGFKRIRIETNGRLFAYPKFASAVLDAGATEIAINLPAHSEKLALQINPIPGALKQTIRGLKNLLQSDSGNLTVSTIVPV
ncbi:MAG: radical SAM protein, partial [bacterium]